MIPIIKFLKNKQKSLNIAHRGGMGLYPENTLLGFHASVSDHHADMLEMDLRITKDGKVLVFHDDTLERTTNGKGKVCDHTYHEISELDAGYYFTNNKIFQYRDKEVKAPLLEDIFEQFPDTYVNIEIKDSNEEAVIAVLRIINKFSAQDRIIIGSGKCMQNRRIRHVIPDCGHYLSEVDVYLLASLGYHGWGKKYWQKFDVVEIPLLYHRFDVYSRLKSAAEKIGLPLFVWGANNLGVNDLPIIERLKADKVDGIITDRPDLM